MPCIITPSPISIIIIIIIIIIMDGQIPQVRYFQCSCSDDYMTTRTTSILAPARLRDLL
jgi:hypothetical protein